MLLNLLLAIAWVALTGDFSAANALAGVVIGLALMWVLDLGGGRGGYPVRVLRAVRFALFFAWEMLLANLRVAWLVIHPRPHLRPAIVALPLDVASDAAIQLFAATITLTPGTLSIDLSSDRRTLYVHVAHVGDDVDAFVRDTKASFERRIREMLE
jgi:multicomponent Na+:H+ antiporter subunit E